MFSGGVDSTACLELLPNNAVLVNLHRMRDKLDISSPYNPAAMEYACDVLRKNGRSVFVIDSDLEFMRDNFVGLPSHESIAVPALLLADFMNLDSVAFGTISEPTYRLGHSRFEDFKHRRNITTWKPIYACVGLHYNPIICGISEDGSTIIMRNSKYRNIAQSCQRGDPGQPCIGCRKCFRKILLEMAITGTWCPDEELSRFFRI